MKTILFIVGLLLVQPSLAQKPTESQLTKQGFWVIEGNPLRQRYTIVRYYTADRRLISEEVVNKRWIDIRKKRNIRKLDRKLMGWLAHDATAQVAVAPKRNP